MNVFVVSIANASERKSNKQIRKDFKTSCMSFGLNSTYSRSKNWCGFKRPGLKTGVENNIFQSEIGSGSGEPGGTCPFTGILPHIYQVSKRNTLSYSNYLQTHGTAMKQRWPLLLLTSSWPQ